MTINTAFVTVADSIAGISISGVTVKDINEIPENVELLCPVLIPQPNDYITNLSVERMSFGGGGTAKLDMTYTLNYVYLHSAVGGLSQFDAYSGIITKLELILEAILTNDNIAGPVDFEVETIPSIGVIEDPAGGQYWGTLLSFRVTEHVQ
jgi:hypothetical protein